MSGRRFTVESAMGSTLARARREARALDIFAMADRVVTGALDGCDEGQRAELTLALLDRAVVAVAALHDAELVQARLGRLANHHGSAIKPQKAAAKAKADAVFGGSK